MDSTTRGSTLPQPGQAGEPPMARVDCDGCGAFAVVLTDHADKWHTDHRCGDLIDQVLARADDVLALQLQRDAEHGQCTRDRINCDHAALDDQIATERLALTELVYGARAGGGQA